MDEFAFIAKHLAPLAAAAPGAYGLRDDAAVLAGGLVVTVDTLVAGVHFRVDDPADTIARKVLRVNLSDLAAMGATPGHYLLSAQWPTPPTSAWIDAFTAALAADQSRFGITLAGGDTVRTPGPLAFSVTALGHVATPLRRAGARPGDDVWVSGTIGDAALGLAVLEGRLTLASGAKDLVQRYQVPEPRLALGQRLVGLAHAAMDVSDGLAADLAHLCRASGLGAEVAAERVPLSPGAAAALAEGRVDRPSLLTGGDDYELLFTAPPDRAEAVMAASAATATPVARIGRITGDACRLVDAQGGDLVLKRAGYQHF